MLHETPLSKTAEEKNDENGIHLESIKPMAPYPMLFRDCVLAARRLKASDIHLQPTSTGIDIRFRVLGDLFTWKHLSIEHRQSFINEIKRLTNLSIAVSGRAQDGRVSYKNWNLDLRVNLLPSQFGEKIVLRLLDLNQKFDMPTLGFDLKTLKDLTEALRFKNGLMVISGPTGSGKTTTLYTLLCSIDRFKKNIITLEDPIEYGIDGLTQVQVSPKLSFADSLRSVLRQDPDVILVGEIRDSETANLCLKASATGHLVLTTLHANNASEVVGRLLNLGVDDYMLRSCLRLSSAQRLIKKLCPQCSIPSDMPLRRKLEEHLLQLKIEINPGPDLRIRNLKGCPKCIEGITGRVPVLEYMKSSEIKDYLSHLGKHEVRPTLSLKESCLRRAEKGEVDVTEIFEIE